MRALRAWLWLSLVALGCAQCRKPATAPALAQPVERVLPRGAAGVVVMPALLSAGKKLQILERLKVADFAAQLQGFADGRGLGEALMGELGVDLRSAEALEEAGVDGARAAGLAALMTGEAYLALPVKDVARFHARLEKLARRLLGAPVALEQAQGVKVFSPGQGEPGRLGYVMAHGYALITDTAGIEKLAGLATMSRGDCLAADPGYEADLQKLPRERDLVLYLPLGTPLLAQAPVSAVAGAVSLTSAGLRVSANATWKGDAESLAGLVSVPGKSLLGYLPEDAFLVARYTGDPARLAPQTGLLLGPWLSRAFEQGQLDLRGEVLEHLQPGVVASLSLSPKPPMDRGLPALDVRQTNPFTYAHLSGAALTKSPQAMLRALEKLALLAPKFGAQMTLRERPDGQKALLTTYAQGEGVHFAPKGEMVFFASPVQRLDALVKADPQSAAPLDGLGDGALSVAIDLTKLSQSVRALPESSWGVGGFAMKSTAVRWLEATDDLRRVSISVGAKDQALQITAVLSLGGATKGP